MTNMDGLDNNYQNVETLNTPSPETEINVTSNVTGVSGDSMLSLYTKMMVEMRDPRTDGWFMMSSVWPTVILSASYYLIVRHVGPWFMATR